MKKNNSALSVKDRVRAMLLREAADIAPEWRILTEIEEENEARAQRDLETLGFELQSLLRDDRRDDELSSLAMRKLRNEQVLKLLDGLPNTGGRPSSDQWYDDLLAECFNDAGRIGRKVRDLFFERAKERRSVDDPKNQFAQAMKRRSYSA